MIWLAAAFCGGVALGLCIGPATERLRAARVAGWLEGYEASTDQAPITRCWVCLRPAVPGPDELCVVCGRGIVASGTSGSAQDAQRLDPKGAGPTREAGDAQ